MPNWVFTQMSVLGKPEDLKKFVDKAKTPHQTYWKDYKTDEVKEETDSRIISFWNFKKPENEQLYFGASDYKPEGYENMTPAEKMSASLAFKSDGWYDWNCREWGTKWDASDPYMTDNSDKGSVSYEFSTAWSPAEGAFQAMVQQHPELRFEFRCIEEQGWGVEFSGEDGELSVVDEWEIPDSHKEWVERDGECRSCSWEDSDPEDWYDDCPDKTARLAEAVEETKKEVERFEDISEMIV